MSLIDLKWYKNTLTATRKMFDHVTDKLDDKADLINGKVDPKQLYQYDFAENDPNNIAYIKNRTHYIEDIPITEHITYLFEETNIECIDGSSETYIGFIPQIGQQYMVVWDGVEYECLCLDINSYDDRLLGNPGLYGDNQIGQEDPSKPFAIFTYNDGSSYGIIASQDGAHTIAIINKEITGGTVVHKLDLKYIPDGISWNSLVDKPFGELTTTNKTLLQTSFYIDTINEPYMDIPVISLVSGQVYNVIFDDVLYECTVYIAEYSGTPSIGNDMVGGAGETGGNGEPFFYTVYEGEPMLFASTASDHAIEIRTASIVESTIEPKYIPKNIQSDWTINNPESHAYVKNRPFYDPGFEIIYDSENPLEWVVPGYVSKASNLVLSREDVIGSCCVYGSNYLNVHNEETLLYETDGLMIFYSVAFVFKSGAVCPEWAARDGGYEGSGNITFPEPGIYALNNYMSSMKRVYKKVDPVKLDHKFLPNNIVVKDDLNVIKAGRVEQMYKPLIDTVTFTTSISYQNGYRPSSTMGIKSILDGLIAEGEEYAVLFDGILYTSNCVYIGWHGITLGNLFLLASGNDTGEPFCVSTGDNRIITQEPGTHTFSVGKMVDIKCPIRNEYLPEHLQFGETSSLVVEKSDMMSYDNDILLLRPLPDSLHKDGRYTIVIGDSVFNERKLLFNESESRYYFNLGISDSNGSPVKLEEADVEYKGVVDNDGYLVCKVWRLINNDQPSIVKIYREGELKQLDEKYIPDTIQRAGNDVILTAQNGTQYKITVADDGTLSTTPV